MNPLEMPPCLSRGRDASQWPSHRAKARAKIYKRRRVIADLNREREKRNAISFCV